MEPELDLDRSGALYGRIEEDGDETTVRSDHFARRMEHIAAPLHSQLAEALSAAAANSALEYPEEHDDLSRPGDVSSIAELFGQRGGGGSATGGSGEGRVMGIGDVGGTSPRVLDAPRAPRSRVTLGDAEITGSLTQEQVHSSVRRYLNQIRHCFDRELLRDPGLAGQIIATWTIAPDGMVSEASIATNTTANQDLAGCLRRTISRMVFEEPSEGTVVLVRFPFNFGAVSE